MTDQKQYHLSEIKNYRTVVNIQILNLWSKICTYVDIFGHGCGKPDTDSLTFSRQQPVLYLENI